LLGCLITLFYNILEINECLSEESVTFCPPNSHCVNTIGSYACECDTGFLYSNYSTCEDVNECVEVTFPVCSINAQCLNRIGGYDCICRFGLVWSNELKNCIDIDECDIKVFKHQVCENNAICENSFGSYKCNCKNGWHNIDLFKCEGKKRFNL
jgi:hypothetical protein